MPYNTIPYSIVFYTMNIVLVIDPRSKNVTVPLTTL